MATVEINEKSGNMVGVNGNSRFRRELWWRLPLHVILIIGAGLMLLPFIWMIATSFKPPSEVVAWPPTFIPQSPTLENYGKVFELMPFARYFLNSLIVTLVCMVTICLTSSLAGYIFGIFRFPLRNFFFIVILATAIVPFETYMIPLYLLMKDLKSINSFQGIMAPYFIMSFGIFFMRQNYIAFLPEELLDAARIDGAGEWKIYWRIVLPLSSSALAALAIYAFINVWAAFIWPLLVVNTSDLKTIELALAGFQTAYTVEYGPLMAGSVISLLPILAIFIVLRRQIIESVAMTGMK
ncbi:MAG: carbohydrate ABC transporter permease [Chloroflexi bacterium]|nr:carbohydrate ABC transporter permease [Chloroflexota bacterium]